MEYSGYKAYFKFTQEYMSKYESYTLLYMLIWKINYVDLKSLIFVSSFKNLPFQILERLIKVTLANLNYIYILLFCF